MFFVIFSVISFLVVFYYYYYYFHGMIHRCRINGKENYKILFIYRWMLMLFIVIVPEKYI